MKRFVTVCALSMFVAACKSPVGPTPVPQGGRFTLSGRVTDSENLPVAGARVEALSQVDCTPDTSGYPYYPEYPPAPASCVVDKMFGADETDANGAFSIADLPAGYFTVNVTTRDGVTTSEGVNLVADSSIEMSLGGNPLAAVRRAPTGP
jgi:hypothetical protein